MSSEMVNEGFWFSRVRGKQVRCRKDLEKEFFLPFLRRLLCVSWPVWTILQHYKPFTHILICVTQSNPPQFRAPLEVPNPDNLTFIYFTIYTGQFSTSLRKPLKRQMSFCTFWREVAKIRAQASFWKMNNLWHKGRFVAPFRENWVSFPLIPGAMVPNSNGYQSCITEGKAVLRDTMWNMHTFQIAIDKNESKSLLPILKKKEAINWKIRMQELKRAKSVIKKIAWTRTEGANEPKFYCLKMLFIF